MSDEHSQSERLDELLSAQLDGALGSLEQEELLTWLARDSAAQRQRQRLGRLVRTLRGSGPLLSLEPEEARAISQRLGARLDLEAAEALRLEREEPTPLSPEVAQALRSISGESPLVPASESDHLELAARLAAEPGAELGTELELRESLAGSPEALPDGLLLLLPSSEPEPEPALWLPELPGRSPLVHQRRISPWLTRGGIAAALLLSAGLFASGGGSALLARLDWRQNPTPTPSGDVSPFCETRACARRSATFAIRPFTGHAADGHLDSHAPPC